MVSHGWVEEGVVLGDGVKGEGTEVACALFLLTEDAV
jgi:hypothetical protein